jgi:hypothetical protein
MSQTKISQESSGIASSIHKHLRLATRDHCGVSVADIEEADLKGDLTRFHCSHIRRGDETLSPIWQVDGNPGFATESARTAQKPVTL